MIYYHNCERSQKADERMAAEIQLVAGSVEELGFSREGVDWRIIRPVESELIDRFGHEVGPRLAAHFVNAFENSGGALSPPKDSTHA